MQSPTVYYTLGTLNEYWTRTENPSWKKLVFSKRLKSPTEKNAFYEQGREPYGKKMQLTNRFGSPTEKKCNLRTRLDEKRTDHKPDGQGPKVTEKNWLLRTEKKLYEKKIEKTD